MNRYITKLLILTSTIIFLTNCKKIGKTYDVFFYTNIETPTGPLSLNLDNKNIGELPILKTTLSTNNDTIKSNAIHLKLKTGRYKIQAKDSQGIIKFSGTLIFRFNNVEGSSKNPGAIEYAMSNNILALRIHL